MEDETGWEVTKRRLFSTGIPPIWGKTWDIPWKLKQ